MRQHAWRILLVCVFLLCARTAQAVTYYVATNGFDSVSCGSAAGDGTGAQNPTTPRKTVMGGKACMRNDGGDILYIRAGTYDQLISPPFKSGTSDLNRNMIAGYPGETVILKATGQGTVFSLGPPSATSMIKFLIFENFILEGTGGTGNLIGQEQSFGKPNVAYIGWNIFRNIEVRNGVGSGILNGNHHDEYHHLNVHDNGLHHPVPQSHGIYMCAPDALVHDNEIYHNGAYGIQWYTTKTGCSSRTKFYNNKVYDNAAITDVGGQTAGGMVLCCGDSNEIYNNYFYNNGRSGAFPGHGLQIDHGGPKTNIKACNNTIYNNKNFGIIVGAGTPHVDLSNNIVWQNGGGVLNDASGNSSPFDPSNLTANPMFTTVTGALGAYDFTPLTGSPAIDTGVANHLVTDALDKPRPSGSKIDKGAIEVQQGGGPGPGPGTPGTFYVDLTATNGDTANDCNAAKSLSTPKQTITGAQGGLSCVAAAGAGSKLLIKAGVYTEKIDTNDLPALPGGTDWDHATTIAAVSSDVVTLQIPITGTGARVGMFFRDAVNSHYFIIDRINIDGANGQYTNGFVCYPGAHHIRFQNAEIKNTYYEPVFIKDAANCEVLGATLHDWLNISGVHALGAVSGTIVRNTIIFNGPGSGIKIDANEASPATAISDVLLEQNTVFQVGITSSLAAMLLGGTNNTNLIVRNNVLYNSYRGIEIVTGTPSAKILNNTVYGMTTTGIQANSLANSTQVRNNISYNNGGTAIGDASGTMIQQTNLITDPSFINASVPNFQLQPVSTAINQGTNLADVVFDFLGVTRAQYGVTDIGAYEFTGTVSSGDILGPRRIGGASQGRGMFEQR